MRDDSFGPRGARRSGHALAMLALLALGASAPAICVDHESRIESLLSRMTQDEKVRLMSGGSSFGTAGIERLGIPAMKFADGPNGVRSNNDEVATVFPVGSALAATWNPAAARLMGESIGSEAKALGVQVLLGPNVNIQRTPLAGRDFESYSEDPYLAGRIGVGFVQGVQSQGVGTSPKHFVGNEQELERLRSNSRIDERALHEIYLAPFEMIVREAKPWTVMAAYNRVNGTYMTENSALLRGVLKGQWGFDGVLMSDWGAVHATVESANGGTDLEMPGPAKLYGASLLTALRDWKVEQPVIDDAARRMLRLAERTGALDKAPPAGHLDAGSERHADAAVQVAREAVVLLKNDANTLPLDRGSVHRIAVIGPNADVPLMQGGGSANVVPSRLPTPLESLRRIAGGNVQILHARGVDNDTVPAAIDARLLSPDRERRHTGLAYSFYKGERIGGTAASTGVEQYFEKTMFASDMGQMAARWEGWFWPPEDGEYEWRLAARGDATLSLDDHIIIGPQDGTALPADSDFMAQSKLGKLKLAKGHAVKLRLDYVSTTAPFHQVHLGLRLPPPSLDAAVAAAQQADAAIVFVGVSRTSETEGRDRTDMHMHGGQDELVDAIRKANPRTIVVLNNGSPLALPWVDRIPAIVEAWLPGQGGADALAQILFGDANPSGKLPFTFPKRLEDSPGYLYYGGGRDAFYGEGVFVGYRYYDRRDLAPLFAFGHGLSYTRFEYSNLRVPQSVPGGEFEVSVDVRNTGKRSGAEVVQLYVGDAATHEVVRPPKELKGFEKVTLAAGETRTLHFKMQARDLSYYDIHVGDWIATPGRHSVLVGSSAADIRLQQPFEWTAPRDARLAVDTTR